MQTACLDSSTSLSLIPLLLTCLIHCSAKYPVDISQCYLTRIVSNTRSVSCLLARSVGILCATSLDRCTSETSVTNRPLRTLHSNSLAFVGPPRGVTSPSMNCHSHYIGEKEHRRSKHTRSFLDRCHKHCLTNIYPESNFISFGFISSEPFNDLFFFL